MIRQEADLFETRGKALPPAQPPQELLTQLLKSSLVLVEECEILPEAVRATLLECSDTPTRITLLQEHHLLTQYQADRIEAGFFTS